MNRNFGLVSQTAILALIASACIVPSTAYAQSQGTSANNDEIIVTARKREETIQDVPLSVSAISGINLERGGIESLEDVANFTPGLTFQEFNGGGLGAPVIRGLAQTDIASFNNNVGVFLDGVFLSSKANLDISLFELDRVEVTRGPQSALYGNNSFSGAVNYVTRRGAEEFGGTLSATAGTDERYDLNGSISGPLGEGISGRLTAGYSTFDGTIENSVTEENLGGYDFKYSASGALDFDPTENFSATLFGYYGEEKLDGTAGFIAVNNCGGPNSLNSAFLTGRGGSIDRLFCGSFEAPDEVNVIQQAFSLRESLFGYFKFDYDFGGVTLASTTSFGDYTADALSDQNLSATAPDLNRQTIRPFIGNSKDFSQEIRLESYDQGAFDWVLGGYYVARDLEELFQTGSLQSFLDNSPSGLNRFQNLESDAYSVFGLVSFDVSDQLSLSGELRYTEDKQDFARSQSFGPFPAVLGAESDTFDFITFRGTADYELDDASRVYASIAKGAKSGGFNVSADPSESAFGEESNITYEAGYKRSLGGGLGAFNAAVFYVDWSDVQIPTPSSVAGNANVTQNFGNASAIGFEADVTLKPADNTVITAGYAFSDATFEDGTEDLTAGRRCATPADCNGQAGPNGGVLVGGNQLPRSAKHQFSASLTQYVPSDFGRFYLRGDLSAQSKRFSTPLNLQDDGGRTLVNARIGVEVGDNVDLSIWSNNLFDEKYVNSSINEPEFFPSSTFSTAFIGNGSTFGATAKYKY